MKESFCKKLILCIAACMILVVFTVFALDPFYHYHSPWFGMKAVLTEPEYQVIGTIRNFDYQGIILGSSVAENFDNDWFEDGFDVKVIKGIKKSGTTAYLLYFLDEALKNHELKYVFYSMDTSALLADYKVDLENDGMPMYLYDNNIVNDVNYVFNKDVIFEKIPYMLAKNFSSDYKEGESYSWAKYKTFSEEIARANSSPVFEVKLPEDEYEKYVAAININIDEICKRVENNSDTIFYFWIPPYSSLWEETQKRQDTYDVSMWAINEARDRLCQYENVHFISFLEEKEITENLDNYMDQIHYSQEINYYMYQKINEER